VVCKKSETYLRFGNWFCFGLPLECGVEWDGVARSNEPNNSTSLSFSLQIKTKTDPVINPKTMVNVKNSDEGYWQIPSSQFS
jgi:hypothetical protein